MRKIKYVIIILMLFIGIKNIKAFTFDNTIKVYDYAQILTEKEEDKLIEKVNEYINKYDIDMVIVTVKYYEKNTLKEYMDLFYNTNEFGNGINKRGIFIVLDLKNNDVGIETYNLDDSLYNDFELKNIKLSVSHENKYYNKLLNFIDLSDKYLNEDYSVKLSINNPVINYLIIIIISIFIPTLVVMSILFKVNKYKVENTKISYLKENSLLINKREDKFLTTHTKQINR